MELDIKTSWGRNITTKFYLNTSLKPLNVGDRKDIYPLYVRVICKQQVSQFKYFGKDLEPQLYSKKDFERIFGDIDFNASNDELRSKGIGVGMIASLKDEVDYILNLLGAFERKEFKIKELPGILKSYYEIEKSVLKISARSLTKEMIKNGYGSLIPIIDWRRQHPTAIEAALQILQEDFDLPIIKINYNSLPFFHIKEVLNLVKNEKVSLANSKLAAEKIMSKINIGKAKDFSELIMESLVNSIEFYKTAIKLTSR